MQLEYRQSAGQIYRLAVAAADVIAVPGTLTTSVVNGGSLANTTAYNSKVVAGTLYGRTTPTGGTQRTTSSPNLTLRIAFATVVGATFYDIYVSTDTDPKWVGRITEAQRAAGCAITAVGVVGAGGTAGAVDVQVTGTGQQSATTSAVNTAYSIPASPISMVGNTFAYQYIDFDLAFNQNGDSASPALVVVPWYQDSNDGNYYAGTPVTLSYGGTTGQYGSLAQSLRVEGRGCAAVALLVQSISGTNSTVDMRYRLS